MALNSERRGAGPGLLMVHGLGGSVRSWDAIAPALSRSREVILIDLPGHGKTPPIAGRQMIDAYAGAIADFITEQGLGAVDLVGSSVGARLVLELSRWGVGVRKPLFPTLGCTGSEIAGISRNGTSRTRQCG